MTNKELTWSVCIAAVLFFLAGFLSMGCAEPINGVDGKSIVGPQGPKGDTGAPGYSPTVTVSPAPTLVCPAGGVQVTVDDSTSYLCNGTNGQNATTVTPVQLCPGVSTYPSVFVEYGLCLNNELYAVYSTHGGFLTKLPMGTYTSNAVGSKCDLIVGQNCQVSH